MAATVNSSVVVGRPVEDVFSYVLDLPSNGPEWAPDLESAQKTTDGPIGAGTTFQQVQHVMGKRRKTSLIFTAVEPNHRIAAEVKAGPMTLTMSVTFDDTEAGTLVTADGGASGRGPLRLLEPLFARQGQKIWDARLARLKEVLESSGSS